MAKAMTKFMPSISSHCRLLLRLLWIAIFSTLSITFSVPIKCAWAVGEKDEHRAPMKISEIYFFGYGDLDLERFRAIITSKSRDEIEQTPHALASFEEQISNAVETQLGKKATDVAPVFYQNSWILYVGLPGTSSRVVAYNSIPKGNDTLPKRLVENYLATMDANFQAIETGCAEDKNKYNQLKEQSSQQSKNIPDQLMQVLKNSGEPLQRAVAAHCLGLIAHTAPELIALTDASKDADSVVRNNAVRALGVIASEGGARAKLIPAVQFVQLLSLGIWTDRNKGSFLISELIKIRDAKLIDQLRSESIPALKEMAAWDRGHATPALRILGVIANIPDARIDELIAADDRKTIIDALK